MSMRLRFVSGAVFLAALLVLFASSARAGVVYSFTSTAGTFNETFVYIAPGFVVSDVTISAASLDSCSMTLYSCESVLISPSGQGTSLTADSIIFNYRYPSGAIAGSYFYFADGSFSIPGTHLNISVSYPATLTITSVPDPVPEPASFLCVLGAAVAALGWRVSRRKGA
jgi:hypothetical protein